MKSKLQSLRRQTARINCDSKYVYLSFYSLFSVLFVFLCLKTIENAHIHSDYVSYFLFMPELGKHLVYLPTDMLFFHFPAVVLALRIFGLTFTTIKTVILFDAVLVSISFCLFSFFFVRTFSPRYRYKILLLLPIIFLITLFTRSNDFYFNLTRTLEICMMWFIIYFFHLFFTRKNHSFHVVALLIIGLYLLFLDDPFFIYTLGIALIASSILLAAKTKKVLYLYPILFVFLAFIGNSLTRGFLQFSNFVHSQYTFTALATFPTFIQHSYQTLDCLQKIFGITKESIVLNSIQSVLVMNGLLGLVLLLIAGIRKNNFLFVLIPLVFLANIVANMLSSYYAPTVRYLILTPFMLCLGMSFLLAQIKTKQIVVISFCLLLVIQALYSIIFTDLPKPESNEESTTLIHLLENEQLRYGYGDYWIGTIATFLSQNNIRIRQINCINGILAPYLIVSAKNWYDPSSFEGPTFLVFEDNGKDNFLNNASCMRLPQFKTLYGNPQEEKYITVGSKRLLLYVFDYNIAARF